MHADYFKEKHMQAEALQAIKAIVPTVEIIWPSTTDTHALMTAIQLAKKYTQRCKILILADPLNLTPYAGIINDEYLAVIPAGNAAVLCAAIANSAERIAAVIIKYEQASPYYYKKVRELTSAEGAVMILDSLAPQRDKPLKFSKNSQPDMICCHVAMVKTASWIAGKAEMMALLHDDQEQ